MKVPIFKWIAISMLIVIGNLIDSDRVWAGQDVFIFYNKTGAPMRVQIATGASADCDQNEIVFSGMMSADEGGRRVLLKGREMACWRIESGKGWTDWQQTRCDDPDPNKPCSVSIS